MLAKHILSSAIFITLLSIFLTNNVASASNSGLGLGVNAGEAENKQARNTKSESITLAQNSAAKGLRHADIFPGFAKLCDIETPLRDMSVKHSKSAHSNVKRLKPSRTNSSRKKQTLGPMQVFNNLYFVGAGNVSSWAIDTGESIVLIDALNNEVQAQKYIIDGLKALGLDNKPISHLIITHGHGDHYGGQSLISRLYQPQIIMSSKEWKWLAAGAGGFSSARWGQAPVFEKNTAKDEKPGGTLGINDASTIRVGDNTFTFYVTPGHTPGTLSVMFNVINKGNTHKAILWGGTGLNYGADASRIKTYTESAARMRQLALAENIDVFLSNHPKMDGSDKKLAALKKGGPNPFIVGNDTVEAAFDMLYHCTTAQYIIASHP